MVISHIVSALCSCTLLLFQLFCSCTLFLLLIVHGYIQTDGLRSAHRSDKPLCVMCDVIGPADSHAGLECVVGMNE